jgi:hypothetical protein
MPQTHGKYSVKPHPVIAARHAMKQARRCRETLSSQRALRAVARDQYDQCASARVKSGKRAEKKRNEFRKKFQQKCGKHVA